MSLQDGGYTQGQLTFIDPDGYYGADTQGLEYGYDFTPLSQTQSQTQSSQLTQPDDRTNNGKSKTLTYFLPFVFYVSF